MAADNDKTKPGENETKDGAPQGQTSQEQADAKAALAYALEDRRRLEAENASLKAQIADIETRTKASKAKAVDPNAVKVPRALVMVLGTGRRVFNIGDMLPKAEADTLKLGEHYELADA